MLSLRERIRGPSGEAITWAALGSLIRKYAPAIQAVSSQHGGLLTKFEVLTGLAFRHFADECVDCAVVEVGLGGVLDATNVIPPSSLAAAVITAIGLDHVDALGGSLLSIARAKAGIMKPQLPVVIGPQAYPEALAELLAVATQQKSSPLVQVVRSSEWDGVVTDLTSNIIGGVLAFACQPPEVDPRGHPTQELTLQTGGAWSLPEVKLKMIGSHMAENAAVAAATALVLRLPAPNRPELTISDAAVAQGLSATVLPGRFQVLSQEDREDLGLGQASAAVLDGAHTGESAVALSDTLVEAFRSTRAHLLLVLAMANDKDHTAVLSGLHRLRSSFKSLSLILTQVPVAGSTVRTASSAELRKIWLKVSESQDSDNPPTVLVTQSLDEALEATAAAMRSDDPDSDKSIVCFTGSLHLAGRVLSRTRSCLHLLGLSS